MATASIKPIEIIDPINADNIIIPEPKFIPRPINIIIIKDTTSLAPDDIPSTNGPAIGLLKNVCSKKPDTDNAPPRSSADNITRKHDLPYYMI